MPNVTNASSTMGFVDLNELYGDEIVTTVNPSLLQDAAKAAEALDDTQGYNQVQVHLVAAEDGADNPAIALSTNRSRPMAAMVASVRKEDTDNDDA